MNKFALGFILGIATAGGGFTWSQRLPALTAEVNTNGLLYGYIAQDLTGQEVFRDPSVWLQFREPNELHCLAPRQPAASPRA